MFVIFGVRKYYFNKNLIMVIANCLAIWSIMIISPNILRSSPSWVDNPAWYCSTIQSCNLDYKQLNRDQKLFPMGMHYIIYRLLFLWVCWWIFRQLSLWYDIIKCFLPISTSRERHENLKHYSQKNTTKHTTYIQIDFKNILPKHLSSFT